MIFVIFRGCSTVGRHWQLAVHSPQLAIFSDQ